MKRPTEEQARRLVELIWKDGSSESAYQNMLDTIATEIDAEFCGEKVCAFRVSEFVRQWSPAKDKVPCTLESVVLRLKNLDRVCHRVCDDGDGYIDDWRDYDPDGPYVMWKRIEEVIAWIEQNAGSEPRGKQEQEGA